MNSKWHMEVECLAAGQPRAYADSVYTHKVTFTRRPPNGEVEPRDIDEKLVEAYCRLIEPWVDEGEGNWASPELKYLRKEKPGVWKFCVTRAYTG